MTADELSDVIALSIHEATAPLLAKIAALEARPVVVPEAVDALKSSEADIRARLRSLEGRAAVPVNGPVGPPGPPGERGESGPAGRDGVDGTDGVRGVDGKDGAPGIDGKDGAPGITGRDGAPGIDGKDGAPGHIGPAGEMGPAGAIGRDGRDGKDGAPGLNGRDGAPGLDGKDGSPGANGKDGAPGLNGKDGADGLNGKDGLGFDDMDLVFDESRGFVLRFQRGEQVKEFSMPVPYDAGVWQSGRVYPKGAGVTRDRSFWIAQDAASARPGDESAASRVWRLAVCHGRDGKPGKDGRNGTDA